MQNRTLVACSGIFSANARQVSVLSAVHGDMSVVPLPLGTLRSPGASGRDRQVNCYVELYVQSFRIMYQCFVG